MEGEIINAIAARLREAFGEEIPVVSGGIGQEDRAPCFHVQCVSTERKSLPSRQWRQKALFAVQYLPGTDQSGGESAVTAGRLYELLEVIGSAGNMWRGTGMQCENKDGTLHFSVYYNYFLRKEEVQTQMEELTVEEGIL